MKKLKAIASSLLAVATVLSLTACEEEGPGGSAPVGNAPTTTDPISTTTYAENDGVNDAVKNLDPTKLDDPDINYLDYIEIANAVRALGGEVEKERSFEGDPYYESMKRLGAFHSSCW